MKFRTSAVAGLGAAIALGSVVTTTPAAADTSYVVGPTTITQLDDGSIDLEHDLLGTVLSGTASAITPPVAPGAGQVGPVRQLFDTSLDAYAAGDLQSAATNTTGGCDPQGEVTYQYTPVPSNFKDRGIQMSYTVVAYQRNHAHFRPDRLEFTWQVALCGFGGSKTYNGWRLLRSGLGVSLAPHGQRGTTVKIGQAYDTSISDAISSGSVSFNVAAGPGSVGVSIGTTATGKNKGDAGVTGPQTPDGAAEYSRVNVVHGYWDHYAGFYVPVRNKGSRDFQGSIAEGLYEMGETSQPSAKWVMQPFAKRHCTTWNYSCPL